jgi:hypothetical protein
LSEGMDEATFWATVGLRMRLQRDLQAFEQFVGQGRVRAVGPGQDVQSQQVWRFMSKLQRGGVAAVSEADLQGLQPPQRGFAYSAAVTALGAAAPQAWRDGAKRLLFVTERPHFN